ncbi:MAG TPA: hypothetical protein VF269_06085 [Rhodanobacteraceae bacterium]
MRAITLEEMSKVAGGLQVNGSGGMHANLIKGPSSPYDGPSPPGTSTPSTTTTEVTGIGTSLLEELDARMGDGLLGDALYITDAAQISAGMASDTYAFMIHGCELWEANGNMDGSPVVEQMGTAFDVNMINWSAYDDGGADSCATAIGNLYHSVFADHQAMSINPAWAASHSKKNGT